MDICILCNTEKIWYSQLRVCKKCYETSDKEIPSKYGFYRDGIHEKTGTRFNEKGYDKDGYDKDGFNKDRIHQKTGTRFNEKGYDKDGYDKNGYDKNGNLKKIGVQFHGTTKGGEGSKLYDKKSDRGANEGAGSPFYSYKDDG